MSEGIEERRLKILRWRSRLRKCSICSLEAFFIAGLYALLLWGLYYLIGAEPNLEVALGTVAFILLWQKMWRDNFYTW